LINRFQKFLPKNNGKLKTKIGKAGARTVGGGKENFYDDALA